MELKWRQKYCIRRPSLTPLQNHFGDKMLSPKVVYWLSALWFQDRELAALHDSIEHSQQAQGVRQKPEQ